MENKNFVFFRIGLLCLGCVILFISLIAANRDVTGNLGRAMTKRLYFGRTLLPDHVFYEAVMASDRVTYLLADKEDRVMLSLTYAERRFQAAQALFDDNQTELAFTTLGKSQKYLFLAADAVLSSPDSYSFETKRAVRDALQHSLYRLQLVQTDRPHTETSEVGDLLDQSRSILREIESALQSK